MKVFCLVAFLFPFLAFGQVDTVLVQRSDVRRGIDVIGYTFGAPGRWEARSWLTLGGIAASTAALTFVDKPVRDGFHNVNSDFLDKFERVGYHYGKPYSAIALSGGFYLTGLVIKDQWARETGLMLFSGLATSTVLQTFFKNAIGRARPGRELGNYSIEPFSSEAANHSFPSGHTTVALTMSLILAKQVHSVPLKILFYSLGTVTAVSRLYSDAHWVSDLAVGGAIAWFCADAAVKRIESNRFRSVLRKQNPVIVKLYPYPGGLTLRAKF
jgi:membrane-associated phospholipid phosphatase